jgi:hypothetical protein
MTLCQVGPLDWEVGLTGSIFSKHSSHALSSQYFELLARPTSSRALKLIFILIIISFGGHHLSNIKASL